MLIGWSGANAEEGESDSVESGQQSICERVALLCSAALLACAVLLL